jgi:hypothetical protein
MGPSVRRIFAAVASFATVFLLTSTPAAVAQNPACAGSADALRHLNRCIPLYCSGKNKDPRSPALIKELDDHITKYQAEVLAYQELVTSFEKVCRKLVTKFCKSCPDYEEFQSLYRRSIRKSDAVGTLERTLRDQGGQIDQKIRDTEGNSACHSQIVSLISLVQKTRHDYTNRFNATKCQP